MKKVLDDIQSGRFVPRLDAGEQGQPDLVQGDPRQAAPQHPIEQVGAKLRAMMPWIKQRALVDKSKN